MLVNEIIELDKGLFLRYKKRMEMLTTSQVAERLGVTVQRVHQLITEGQLPAQKVGRDYIINADDVEKLTRRPVGRPPTKKAGKGTD